MFCLSACAGFGGGPEPGAVGARGLQPTLEQIGIGSSIAAQDQMLSALMHTAGLPPAPPLLPRDPNWSLVWKAGLYEIGRQCDQYLDALFRFNREQHAFHQDLAATAGATGAIMGLGGASATAIAITAAAFGLSNSLFEASVNSILFTIEPSALRNVAQQGLQNYLTRIDEAKILSRPDTLIALQGYLTQCSPAAIEANINNAASGAPSVVSSNQNVAEKSAGLAAPGSAVVTQKPTPLVPPAASKTVEQRAKEAVDQRVVIKPLVVSEDQRPPTVQPGDTRGLTKTQIRQFQAALGVAADGDPGQADSDTRKALQEFQIGLSKRPDISWSPREMNGTLGHRTVDRLSGMKAMPTRYFLSPFERARFGNLSSDAANAAFDVPDVDRLRGVSSNLLYNLENDPELKGKVSGPDLAKYKDRVANNNVDEQLKLMRDMVAEIRKDFSLDTKRLYLDSILEEKMNPRIVNPK
jgi:hypothetical protein